MDAPLLDVLEFALGAAGGVAGYAAWLHRRGRSEGVQDASVSALATRVTALEDGQAEILRHVNERATKADLRAMEASIIAQLNGRFADLTTLLARGSG